MLNLVIESDEKCSCRMTMYFKILHKKMNRQIRKINERTSSALNMTRQMFRYQKTGNNVPLIICEHENEMCMNISAQKQYRFLFIRSQSFGQIDFTCRMRWSHLSHNADNADNLCVQSCFEWMFSLITLFIKYTKLITRFLMLFDARKIR